MLDKPPATHQERLQRNGHLKGYGVPPPKPESEPPDGGEDFCAAFGYLRGIRERADAVEFRFRDGNSVWFPYNWLGTWKFNPSEGLLLKFSGDLVYLVLIRGSNLDRPLGDAAIDLVRAGLQRHRVLWVREMGEEDIRQVGDQGPTIDSIEVAEFESHEALREWLGTHAAGFLG
ncbi:MAG TPA: hypothetical protein PKC45_04335 [Gemmatales bacterium]|mgnify:CR=1 FL=1|nr:hypothetical protein [Gemmatales bacterium]